MTLPMDQYTAFSLDLANIRVAQADGKYGVLFAARKKLFREMATRSARIVSGDLAVRRRSLAPVR